MTSGIMTPLAINALTATSAAGVGLKSTWDSLKSLRTGLSNQFFLDASDLKTWIGLVAGVDDISIPRRFDEFDCRNNKLALMALEQDGFWEASQKAIRRYGSHRVGLFLGTSTSGILSTELAYQEAAQNDWRLPSWYNYAETHNNYSVSQFVALLLGLTGITQTISTACSSSANVFASAQRAIKSGLCDAAIVGGVDSLCLTTLYGFNSLQLLSSQICRPADSRRDGINIGEGAAFCLLTPEDSDHYKLYGFGESSDAYHMSSPHPGGLGAIAAMREAIDSANIHVDEVDYVNLHGTGSKANDSSESSAVFDVLGSTPCSSTKGWTGHTLGAAGALEVAISCLCLQENFIPPSLNTTEVDATLKCSISLAAEHKVLKYVLSNSFGFGGNNCSLLLGK